MLSQLSEAATGSNGRIEDKAQTGKLIISSKVMLMTG
jgi:hypothetical protein